MSPEPKPFVVRTLPGAFGPSKKKIAAFLAIFALLLGAALSLPFPEFRGPLIAAAVLITIVAIGRVQIKDWREALQCGQCSAPLQSRLETSGKHGEPILYPCKQCNILWFAGSEYVD